jgi:hypothetical protein
VCISPHFYLDSIINDYNICYLDYTRTSPLTSTVNDMLRLRPEERRGDERMLSTPASRSSSNEPDNRASRPDAQGVSLHSLLQPHDFACFIDSYRACRIVNGRNAPSCPVTYAHPHRPPQLRKCTASSQCHKQLQQ